MTARLETANVIFSGSKFFTFVLFVLLAFVGCFFVR